MTLRMGNVSQTAPVLPNILGQSSEQERPTNPRDTLIAMGVNPASSSVTFRNMHKVSCLASSAGQRNTTLHGTQKSHESSFDGCFLSVLLQVAFPVLQKTLIAQIVHLTY